jgi:hypothetical protein
MAEKRTLVLEVKTDEALAATKKLEIAIRELKDAEFNLKNANEDLKKSQDLTATGFKIVEERAAKAKKTLEQKTAALKSVDNESKKTVASTNSLTDSVVKNGGAMAVLNTLTGGLAQQFKDAYEASDLLKGGVGRALTAFKGFSTGVKAALISTGIGALVVAVGLLVAYWDDIKELVSGVSVDMINQNEIAAKNASIEEDKLKTLNGQDNILKLQGKSEAEILKIKQKQTADVIKSLEIQLLAQESQRTAQIEASKRNKSILAGIMLFISEPLRFLLKTIDSIGERLGKDFGLEDSLDSNIFKILGDPKEAAEETDKIIKETKDKLNILLNTQAGYQLSLNTIAKTASDERKKPNDEASELDKQAAIKKGEDVRIAKERADALEAIRKAEIDTEAERRAEELLQIQLQYAALIEQAILYDQSTDELKRAQRTKELELQAAFDAEDKKRADDLRAKEKEQSDKIFEELKRIEQEKILMRLGTFNNLISIFGAETSLGQKFIIAKNLLLAKELIIEATKTIAFSKQALARSVVAVAEGVAQTAKVGFPQNIPLLIGYAAQAVGIISAIKSATKKANVNVGGDMGSLPSIRGGDASGPTSQSAPSFNIVGAQGLDNQIATGLGTQPTQPLRAYVVANEVTTQQSLDRNIIQNASLG